MCVCVCVCACLCMCVCARVSACVWIVLLVLILWWSYYHVCSKHFKVANTNTIYCPYIPAAGPDIWTRTIQSNLRKFAGGVPILITNVGCKFRNNNPLCSVMDACSSSKCVILVTNVFDIIWSGRGFYRPLYSHTHARALAHTHT